MESGRRLATARMSANSHKRTFVYMLEEIFRCSYALAVRSKSQKAISWIFHPLRGSLMSWQRPTSMRHLFFSPRLARIDRKRYDGRTRALLSNMHKHGCDAMSEDTERVRAAVSQSVQFLKARLTAGDYGLSCYGPDGSTRFSHDKGHVFSAFFIAEALGSEISEIERTIILTRILSEETGGFWGYSPAGPGAAPKSMPFIVDADDTSYVLRTLRQLGINRPVDCLMKFYRKKARGFVTFDARKKVSSMLKRDKISENNFALHPEVNANVFIALTNTPLATLINDEFCKNAQGPDGAWQGFYYPSQYFATYLFLQLSRGRPNLDACRQRGVRFLCDSQNEDGSWGSPGDPYETALAVNGLYAAEFREAHFCQGIGYLTRTIEDVGCWASDKPIWEFPAGRDDLWTAFDKNNVIVTALSLLALKRAGTP